MTSRPRDIQTILNERLSIIQAIAAANSENLRLNQIAGGMMILDQKDEVEGTDDDLRRDDRAANDTALTRCTAGIEKLEAKLAVLDRELEAATERKK
ncbi:hypothetical protein AB9K34_08270 [Sedimentitalea sp. XS_ASV28]|uniref:hypothetical protein n=1 Tax=Sedimentitalea sp. XS_ASV28 TaxID=3241296 RepID=UPI00351548B3